MPEAQAFFIPLTVSEGMLDPQNHVNNVAYVKLVQDAALAHWYHLAPPNALESVTWVCRRHEVDYLKPAYLADELQIKTWVGEPSGATWERFTEITRLTDRALVLQARTVWVLLDAKTGRPKRVDASVKSWFGVLARTDSAGET